jgi:hypothetical protein
MRRERIAERKKHHIVTLGKNETAREQREICRIKLFIPLLRD